MKVSDLYDEYSYVDESYDKLNDGKMPLNLKFNDIDPITENNIECILEFLEYSDEILEDIEYDMIANESVNDTINVAGRYFKVKKRFGGYIRNTKRYINMGEKAKARKELQKAKSLLDNFKKDVDKLDTETFFDNFVGLIAGNVVFFVKNIALLLGFSVTYAAGTGLLYGGALAGIKSAVTTGAVSAGSTTAMKAGLGITQLGVGVALVTNIKIIVDEVNNLISYYKKQKEIGEKFLDPAIINRLRSESLTLINKLQKTLDKVESKL